MFEIIDTKGQYAPISVSDQSDAKSLADIYNAAQHHHEQQRFLVKANVLLTATMIPWMNEVMI